MLTLLTLVVILVAAYWDTLAIVFRAWRNNPLYSHGYLIPVFAVVLIWMRWEPFRPPSPKDRWLGVGLLGLGLVLWIVATHFAVVTVETYSFVPSLAGLFWLVGGWHLMRWAGPAVLFLVFMFPLPAAFKQNVLERLQHVATLASTYVLQTLGIFAISEGNRIELEGDMQLSVIDACAGLRMGTILFALAVAMALIVRRPLWERILLLLTAIPVALLVNVVRITVTAILLKWFEGNELATHLSHDWAGYFMMPLALGLLYVELEIMARLVIDQTDSKLATAGIRKQQRPIPRV